MYVMVSIKDDFFALMVSYLYPIHTWYRSGREAPGPSLGEQMIAGLIYSQYIFFDRCVGPQKGRTNYQLYYLKNKKISAIWKFKVKPRI